MRSARAWRRSPASATSPATSLSAAWKSVRGESRLEAAGARRRLERTHAGGNARGGVTLPPARRPRRGEATGANTRGERSKLGFLPFLAAILMAAALLALIGWQAAPSWLMPGIREAPHPAARRRPKTAGHRYRQFEPAAPQEPAPASPVPSAAEESKPSPMPTAPATGERTKPAADPAKPLDEDAQLPVKAAAQPPPWYWHGGARRQRRPSRRR